MLAADGMNIRSDVYLIAPELISGFALVLGGQICPPLFDACVGA